MQSIFSKKALKRSKSKDTSAPPVPAKNSSKSSSAHPQSLKGSKSAGAIGLPKVDEHGRTVHSSAPPAFTDSHSARPGANANVRWRQSHDINATEDGDEELQLCYGYWRVETERELSLDAVQEIVNRCGEEIKNRGTSSASLCDGVIVRLGGSQLRP
jgi:hypothetical protein